MSLWILARANNNKKGVSAHDFDCLYRVYSRGACSLCKDHVWTDQQRRRAGKAYFHYECPSRAKKTFSERERRDGLLKMREVSWYNVQEKQQDILCIEE